MDESCGLKRVFGELPSKVSSGACSELVVDQWQELFGGKWVAVFDSTEEGRCLFADRVGFVLVVAGGVHDRIITEVGRQAVSQERLVGQGTAGVILLR